MSIRKVLGASEGNLIYLLTRGFLLLLLISAFIAVPLTYLFFENVAFAEFANHTKITVFELSAGVIMIMTLSLFMISTQTLKAARANPAQVLKTE